MIGFEVVVVYLGKRVKLCAVRHRSRSVFAKQVTRVVAVNVVGDELSSPRKRPHDAIVVFFGVRNFARTHPSAKHDRNSPLQEMSGDPIMPKRKVGFGKLSLSEWRGRPAREHAQDARAKLRTKTASSGHARS